MKTELETTKNTCSKTDAHSDTNAIPDPNAQNNAETNTFCTSSSYRTHRHATAASGVDSHSWRDCGYYLGHFGRIVAQKKAWELGCPAGSN